MRIANVPRKLIELGDPHLNREGDVVIEDLIVHYKRTSSFPAITIEPDGELFSVVRERATAIALTRLGLDTIRAVFDERNAASVSILERHGIESSPIDLTALLSLNPMLVVSVRHERPLSAHDTSRIARTLRQCSGLHIVSDPEFDSDWLFFSAFADPRDAHSGVPLAAALADINENVARIATYNGHVFAPLAALQRSPRE